jgi:hypothetical protein
MPATYNATARRQPYHALPAAALDYALNRRQAGATNPAILRELEALGFDTFGYDATLLNHHVRRTMASRGLALPTRDGRVRVAATGRTTARRASVRAAGRWGTGRRFGLELEVAGLDPYTAARALRAAGVDAQEEGYNHSTRSHWKVTTDGSVCGCEVVSPPLASLDDLQTVCRTLTAAGGRVDLSTGLHVHHEAVDLSPAALAYVVRLMAHCADDLDALLAPSRRLHGRASNWCRRMGATEVDRLAAAFLQLPTRGSAEARRHAARELGLGGRPESRYRALNVHSYGSYGTLEFRQHQGTLSARKVADWVTLGQAILAYAATVPATLPSAGTLVATLVAEGHLDGTVADRMVRRFRAAA